MKSSVLLFSLVLAACAFQLTHSARIVVVYAICSKSHMFAAMPAVEELAKRGHQVTVFTPFKGISKNVVNGKEIFLSEAAKAIEDNDVDWFEMQKAGAFQIFTLLPKMKEWSVRGAEGFFRHQEFMRIVKDRDADLFIVDGLFHEFLYPVFDQIGIPFVTHFPASPFPSILTAMGAPADYASVPTTLTEYDDKMTLPQRIFNALSSEAFEFIRKVYIMASIEEMVQKQFPGAKSIAEAAGDASISIVNSHPAVAYPRSLPPTIIPVGALHTRPAKQLPKELQEFADGATEGLIVFTLGSIVSVSSMPQETIDTFIRVFSKLPQKVIWKWEADEKPNISPNIKMVKWLPQQDLLGHPNAKVFISHGGMLGTQEAAYHGVPILGLPFGNDQRGNIATAKRSGWGYKLDWNNIDDQNLHDALTYLIHDPNVRANATKVSRLMQDEIMPGTDVAAYWIEYVLRHGGTKHLQLAAKNLPFYKSYYIDAIALVTLLAGLGLIVDYYILRAVFRYLFAKKPKTKSN